MTPVLLSPTTHEIDHELHNILSVRKFSSTKGNPNLNMYVSPLN